MQNHGVWLRDLSPLLTISTLYCTICVAFSVCRMFILSNIFFKMKENVYAKNLFLRCLWQLLSFTYTNMSCISSLRSNHNLKQFLQHTQQKSTERILQGKNICNSQNFPYSSLWDFKLSLTRKQINWRKSHGKQVIWNGHILKTKWHSSEVTKNIWLQWYCILCSLEFQLITIKGKCNTILLIWYTKSSLSHLYVYIRSHIEQSYSNFMESFLAG
jgi:hypothetical protein